LTEGKFSFPLIHYIQQHPDDRRLFSTFLMSCLIWLDILKQRTTEYQVKKFAVDLLHGAGSFVYTVQYLQSLQHDAEQEIERLGGNPRLSSILTQLAAAYK
jgi:geranylgeranyl diphosphate synthase type 3